MNMCTPLIQNSTLYVFHMCTPIWTLYSDSTFFTFLWPVLRLWFSCYVDEHSVWRCNVHPFWFLGQIIREFYCTTEVILQGGKFKYYPRNPMVCETVPLKIVWYMRLQRKVTCCLSLRKHWSFFPGCIKRSDSFVLLRARFHNHLIRL